MQYMPAIAESMVTATNQIFLVVSSPGQGVCYNLLLAAKKHSVDVKDFRLAYIVDGERLQGKHSPSMESDYVSIYSDINSMTPDSLKEMIDVLQQCKKIGSFGTVILTSVDSRVLETLWAVAPEFVDMITCVILPRP